jgi:hypothetical protein
MTSSLRTLLSTIAVVAAIIGWSIALVIALRLAPVAAAPDTDLSATAASWVKARVIVAVDPARGTDVLAPYATTEIIAAVAGSIDTASPGRPGLTYVDGEFIVVLRAGDTALIEADYRVAIGSATPQRIGEHLILRVVDGAWKVASTSLVVPVPSDPYEDIAR